MKHTKNILALAITFSLILSLCIFPVAAEDVKSQIAQLDQQIAVLEQDLEALNTQIGAYTSQGQGAAVIGFVASTDPFLVSGSGFGSGMFTDALTGSQPAKYYQIEDPEHGTIDNSSAMPFYHGTHRFISQYYDVSLDGYVNIMGAFADAYYPLAQQRDEKKAQCDALKEQRNQLKKQTENEAAAKQDVLYKYGTDRNNHIVFQLDNPYMLVYGQCPMIEKDNYAARPVAVNGTTLVPIRAVMDAAGGNTYWSADHPNDVGLVLDDKEINLTLNSTTAYVNSKPVTMSVPPQLVNGKTMIPHFLSKKLV